MAIFRDFSKQKRDRSVGDRSRHRELVRNSIRKGIADIIAEESIIGQSRHKKIKVPIKALKEYSFIFGRNTKGVAQGSGQEQKGQILQKNAPQNPEGKERAGSQPGVDIYETEITVEEVINIMFEDLELPKLERKKLLETEAESLKRLLGYKKKGIRSRLSKKKSLINRIKRKKASRKELKEEESFPFHLDDLVYHRTVIEITRHSNAVVFCIMDVSGSMDTVKKYLARSFYFLLYQFLKSRYRNTDIVFLAHHTEAKEVNEDDFFHKVESGGTYISSGYKKALEIIEQRYDPVLWNIYAFHCSDGDNFESDIKPAIEYAEKLAGVCNLFGYGEIKPISSFSWSSMLNQFRQLGLENFICLKIRKKEDVWPAFKKFLTLDKSLISEED
ncbi:YeaH/YhbH family protein [Xanthovirga aplysinae]|uniref:YeaH/YhbH family protein n=1 Tax=Xanthovirga aplysinae TaxID=2529853 RepID=UPI0012BC7C4C|nr:DUF444 family protein [Xanthovirga aplysinae]MTI31018.1 DUF444 family protein [Xanthovirga aplysinae]